MMSPVSANLKGLPAQSSSPQQQLQEPAAYFAEFALPSAPPAPGLVFIRNKFGGFWRKSFASLWQSTRQNFKMHLTLLHLVSC